jgi:hypothetical protein
MEARRNFMMISTLLPIDEEFSGKKIYFNESLENTEVVK